MVNFKTIKRYNTPIHNDIVVCLVSFNAGGFIKPIMNNLYVLNILEASGIPYYLIELSYPGQEPIFFGDNIFHVSANSYMFHKENLFNLLVTKLPAQYTKIVCLDGDVLFSNPNWFNDVAVALDENDVVVPYHDSYMVLHDYSAVTAGGVTLVDNKSNYDNDIYNAGYCICFNRRFFDQVGLFEYAIMGGGDRITLCQFVRRLIRISDYQSTKKQDYMNTIKALDLKFTYLDSDVFHLPHGAGPNRQYLQRHSMLPDLNIDTELVKNADGILEFVNPEKYNHITYNYFKNRKEDI